MITQYFKRIFSQCRELSKINNYPWLYFMIDMIQARVFYGCNLDEYVQGRVYKMKLFERREFISYKRAEKLMSFFNQPDDSKILADKVEFLKAFEKFVKRGWLDCRKASENDIVSFVERYGRVIAKPIYGMKGEGVSFIDNGEGISSELISQLCGKDYLMEECVSQHEALTLGGSSLNTLRVYTLVDKQGLPRIIKAILRAGVGNAMVDNFHQGGLIYPVDLETGRVEERGVKRDFGQRFMFHPGTDTCMLGFPIPNWDKVRQMVLDAALVLPNARYVGWDVAVLQDHVELIEGNEAADFKLITHIGKPFGYHDFLKAR